MSGKLQLTYTLHVTLCLLGIKEHNDLIINILCNVGNTMSKLSYNMQL